MTEQDEEWIAARKLLKKCRACGWIPPMDYEAGVTWAKMPMR